MLKGKRKIFGIIILFFLAVLLINLVSSTQTYLNENNQWEQNLTKVAFSSLVLGDVNNDGYSDMIVTGICGIGCNSAKVYINNGTTLNENSTWEQNLTGVNYGSLALGDINNDGYLDLALTGCNNGGGGLVATCNNGGYQTFIYINNGTSFVESSQWENNLTKTWKGSLAFGDINNDGKLDLALSGQSNTAKISKIYINNGTSLVENQQWENNLTTVYESALTFGDINNDGKLDLALCGDAGISDEISKIYISNGTSLVENSTWEQNLLGVDWCSLTLGDYNDDGYLDLSLIGHTTEDNHDIYRNNGTSFIKISPPGYGGGMIGIYDGSIAFGDYNNDGYLDIIANGWEGYTTLYEYNSSNTNFTIDAQDPESQILNLEASSIVWTDLNNDNNLDLIETGYGGTGGGDNQAFVYISNLSLTKNNTLPSPPTTFTSTYSTTTNQLNLSWGNGSDAETPALGLYYNLMVGNSTKNNTIVSGIYGGSSNPTAGYFGNMMQRKSIALNINLSNGTYYWYVQTIDTGLAKSSWSARQSFIVGTTADTTAPTISSGSASVVASSTATITWTTNEASNSTVNYGKTTALGSESDSGDLVSSHSVNLFGLSSSTLYYYTILSCDSSNNCNTSSQYSFTTSDASTVNNDNGNNNPGGGSSGGSPNTQAPVWTQTYSVSDEQFNNGYTKELSAKNRLQISVNNETHYVGVTGVTNSTATLNITSESQIATLFIGDIRRFEVTGDNYYDLNVTLNSINSTSNKANITVISVHDEITAQTIAEEQTKETTAQQKKTEDIKNERIFWYYSIVGIIIVFIIAVIIFLIKNIKRGRKNEP
jgi:hypothetical protein